MKNYLLILISSCALITGCVTAPDGTKKPDIARVASIAGDAAYIGTAIHLADKPDDRVYFVLTYEALIKLADAENYDPVAFREALQNLPFNGFKGSKGEMYVLAAIVVFDQLTAEAVELDKSQWVKPVLLAVKNGIGRAIQKSSVKPTLPLTPGPP